MPDRTPRSSTPGETPPTAGSPERGRRFRRRMFGYDRQEVDLGLEKLAAEVVELRSELMEAHETVNHLHGELSTAQAQLRYWNDRQSYVDAETERVRAETAKLEKEARERAEAIEQAAQERSLKMIDRVCVEANVILQHAREEAKEMFARCEDDMQGSRTKLERLSALQFEVAASMRKAMRTFEQGLAELEQVAPSTRLGKEILEAPEPAPARPRREAPTFGRARALEAAVGFGENPTGTSSHDDGQQDGGTSSDADGQHDRGTGDGSAHADPDDAMATNGHDTPQHASGTQLAPQHASGTQLAQEHGEHDADATADDEHPTIDRHPTRGTAEVTG